MYINHPHILITLRLHSTSDIPSSILLS